jgi:hypothetical protein
MKLSILIATVEERKEQFNKLFNRLVSLTIDYNGIEIIFNNAPRYDQPNGLTVGEKRQALIYEAKGKYIMFVDDDDDVTDNFILELYPLLDANVDVINAKVQSYIDGAPHIINQSIYFESEQLQQGETRRYPSVMSVWSRKLTDKAVFKPLNNGEDFDWTKQMSPQSEIKVDSIWQIYNYSSINNIASKSERKCIVTFSNTDRYNALADRLGATVKQYGYDFIHYKTYEEINCKPHTEYPYAFKPYSIQKAREQGYNNILWLDSAIYLTQDPKKVFKYIKENGVMLFDNIGFSIGSYTHDECLLHFQMNRDEANNSKMVMACAMGFNFNTEIGTQTFNDYLSYAHTNAFQGSWSNHRHDQSVISCIAKRKGIELLHPNQTFIAYEGNEGMMPHSKDVCLISNG